LNCPISEFGFISLPLWQGERKQLSFAMTGISWKFELPCTKRHPEIIAPILERSLTKKPAD
jgi:hypothetical protein